MTFSPNSTQPRAADRTDGRADGRTNGPAEPPFIDLDRVCLTYGDGEAGTPAIDDVSLRVGRGEFVAIVGPSGCGKSSLLKVVSGLMPPDRGTAVVAGKEVAGPLGMVGMAFQNATLLPWRT
ncbi:MAG TPA: ATP-binding cassette domain-containing protein, partial [Arenibaculum sp.]|nr:ATP-binding cassette domain-containing protein [Arenibaculum sp.]